MDTHKLVGYIMGHLVLQVSKWVVDSQSGVAVAFCVESNRQPHNDAWDHCIYKQNILNTKLIKPVMCMIICQPW